MKISLVGPIKENAKEGKTNPKIFIYQSAFEKMGYETRLFSTSLPKIRVFTLLKRIIESLKYGDTVLLMFGGNASRKLTGLFLRLNKKYKKRLVLCPFGTGPLNPLLSHEDADTVDLFINKLDFGKIKDDKMAKKLHQLDLVVVQNNILKQCFEKFYGLTNVFVLPNFRRRDVNSLISNYKKKSIVYVSRIVEEKGIIDLIKVISLINSSGTNEKIYLDIYGEMHLYDDSMRFFNSNLNEYIKYYGTIPNGNVQKIISSHAISCLPTKYGGEGTPGFLIESLLAGVPIVVSSFSQVNSLIKDGFDGLVFKMNDINDLHSKIISIIFDDTKIMAMRKNAFQTGESYLLENNLANIKIMLEGGNID